MWTAFLIHLSTDDRCSIRQEGSVLFWLLTRAIWKCHPRERSRYYPWFSFSLCPHAFIQRHLLSLWTTTTINPKKRKPTHFLCPSLCIHRYTTEQLMCVRQLRANNNNNSLYCKKCRKYLFKKERGVKWDFSERETGRVQKHQLQRDIWHKLKKYLVDY